MIILSHFTGAITLNILTVTEVQSGALAVGHTVIGDHVPDDVRITLLGTGDGGVGTYALNKTLPLGVAGERMTSGSESLILKSELVEATTRMVIPLLPVPSQLLTIGLLGQNCNIKVYQRTTGLYVDLGISGKMVIGGVIAHDRCRIVRDPYLGFLGDLAFWDSQGTSDPNWTELNSRYYLGYFSPTAI